jgi:hypothetical protein
MYWAEIYFVKDSKRSKKNMIKEKKEKTESEEVKESLNVVSTEIPALIKGIVGSVFSEEAGRNMGKAAAAFYKELKDGGMPEAEALKMTQEYMGTFTSLGDLLRNTRLDKRHAPKWDQEEREE